MLELLFHRDASLISFLLLSSRRVCLRQLVSVSQRASPSGAFWPRCLHQSHQLDRTSPVCLTSCRPQVDRSPAGKDEGTLVLSLCVL